jgi:hypothetical protein
LRVRIIIGFTSTKGFGRSRETEGVSQLLFDGCIKFSPFPAFNFIGNCKLPSSESTAAPTWNYLAILLQDSLAHFISLILRGTKTTP